MGSAGSDPSSIATSQIVNGTDARAAAANNTSVSVNSCRINCCRPAPTASRVAISRRRVAARASCMPATLRAGNGEQRAGQREQESDERQKRRAHRTGNPAHRRQRDGESRIGERLNFLVRLQQGVELGLGLFDWDARLQSSNRHVPHPTRVGQHVGVGSPVDFRTMAIGAHKSVPIIDDPWKPGSATPTTENSRLFSRSGF